MSKGLKRNDKEKAAKKRAREYVGPYSAAGLNYETDDAKRSSTPCDNEMSDRKKDGGEDWIENAYHFLEERRFKPWDSTGDAEEARFFRLIDDKREALENMSNGKFVGAITSHAELAYYQSALRETTIDDMLAAADIKDPEKIRQLRKIADEVDNPHFLIEEAQDVEAMTRALLRHRKLIPEQRTLVKILEDHHERKPRPDEPLPKQIDEWLGEVRPDDPQGLEKVYVQRIKMAWLYSLLSIKQLHERQQPFPHAVCREAYQAVVQSFENTEVYDAARDYIYEAADLAFAFMSDPAEKFMSGVVLATILEREKEDRNKRAVEQKLEELIQEDNIFKGPHFRECEPGKKAGTFYVIDPKGRWVFKRTTRYEAEMLRAVHAVEKNPAQTIWRFTANKTIRSQLHITEGRRLYDQVASDPTMQRYLTLPCVKPVAVVLKGQDDEHIVTMEDAGDTLAHRLKMLGPEQREKLYRHALDMLQKFHFMMTENTIRVDDVYYVAPRVVDHQDQPRLREMDYVQLIRSRVAGGQQRLGESRLFERIIEHIKPIAHFLQRSCKGVIIRDADELNIAMSGLIDLEKMSIGNVMYDVARLLYGASWELKKGIDIRALREHYIKRMTDWNYQNGAIKHQLAISSKEAFQQFIGNQIRNYESRAAYEKESREYWEDLTRRTDGTRPRHILKGLAARTTMETLFDYDYGTDFSEEWMREYCQAAAILDTMGEVGAHVHRREKIAAMGRERNYEELGRQFPHLDVRLEGMEETERELRHAVQNSLRLMRHQGFTELAADWEAYLMESKKIPEEYIETPTADSAFIPDLHERVMQHQRKPAYPPEPRVVIPRRLIIP